MANEPIVTIVGNAIGAALRFTPSGKAVCNFSLASTPRRKDGDQWVDGDCRPRRDRPATGRRQP